MWNFLLRLNEVELEGNNKNNDKKYLLFLGGVFLSVLLRIS